MVGEHLFIRIILINCYKRYNREIRMGGHGTGLLLSRSSLAPFMLRLRRSSHALHQGKGRLNSYVGKARMEMKRTDQKKKGQTQL